MMMLSELLATWIFGLILLWLGKKYIREAIHQLKLNGGYCLAQNEASCVVYGMPKAVVDAGDADVIAPLDQIASKINKAI